VKIIMFFFSFKVHSYQEFEGILNGNSFHNFNFPFYFQVKISVEFRLFNLKEIFTISFRTLL